MGTWVKFTAGWIAIAAVVASAAYLFGSATGGAASHREQSVVGYTGIASQQATAEYVTFVNYRTCADGWQSPSIGKQGACSWHGGVVTRQSEVPHTATVACRKLVHGEAQAIVRKELDSLTTAEEDWSCRGLPEGAELRAVQGFGHVLRSVTEDYEVEWVQDRDGSEPDTGRGILFGAIALVVVAVLGSLAARSTWEDRQFLARPERDE